MNSSGGLILFCLFVGWLVARRTGAGSAAGTPGHSHGGDRTHIATHEAGHVVAAAEVGGTVTRVRMDSGGGIVEWRHNSNPTLVQEVTANVAFLRAGEYAAGTRRGCGDDRAEVRAQLKRLPRTQQATVERAGDRWGRRITASRRGEIARVAARLNERGRL